MKRAQAATVLFVHPQGDASPWADEFAKAGFTVRRVSEEGTGAAIQDAAGAVTAAVLGPGLASPLTVARQLRRMAPLAHIVFLSDAAGAPRLRQALTLAPLLGSHWTMASTEDDVRQVLHDALRSASQRRQLRTTLDRINMRLAEAPPVDSLDYRRLLISDRFLASILNSAQDAIISLDGRGTILTWNEGAKRLFAAGEAEALGLPLTALAADEQADTLWSCLQAAQAGEVARREVLLRRFDSATFDGDVTVAPVRDAAGDLVAVSVMVHDISVRLKAQRELKRLNAELEQRVQERTARLEEANKELESFAYSLSHDLRSPLSSISGFSQALLEDWGESLDGTARHYLERIQGNTRRMEQLISAIMLLSRIARQPLHRANVDLCELARTTLKDVLQGSKRAVRFRCTVSHGADGDPPLLELALENLLNNAFKYSQPERELELELGSKAEGGEVSYYLKDNGIGFDNAYAAIIFEPFQRLHAATDYPGTGIGLATVQRIIQRHGGRIWAEAEPGRGATFYFTLKAGG